MAGGLTGSGHKVGAAMKQQLARIRAACNQGEANNKSNQDLILLLENYNDQVDMVIESLRTGECSLCFLPLIELNLMAVFLLWCR